MLEEYQHILYKSFLHQINYKNLREDSVKPEVAFNTKVKELIESIGEQGNCLTGLLTGINEKVFVDKSVRMNLKDLYGFVDGAYQHYEKTNNSLSHANPAYRYYGKDLTEILKPGPMGARDSMNSNPYYYSDNSAPYNYDQNIMAMSRSLSNQPSSKNERRLI